MPEHEIEDAAAFDKGVALIRAQLRGALIVTDPHIRSLVETYLAIADELDLGWETRIFDTIASARDWLEGRDPC